MRLFLGPFTLVFFSVCGNTAQQTSAPTPASTTTWTEKQCQNQLDAFNICASDNSQSGYTVECWSCIWLFSPWWNPLLMNTCDGAQSNLCAAYDACSDVCGLDCAPEFTANANCYNTGVCGSLPWSCNNTTTNNSTAAECLDEWNAHASCAAGNSPTGSAQECWTCMEMFYELGPSMMGSCPEIEFWLCAVTQECDEICGPDCASGYLTYVNCRNKGFCNDPVNCTNSANATVGECRNEWHAISTCPAIATDSPQECWRCVHQFFQTFYSDPSLEECENVQNSNCGAIDECSDVCGPDCMPDWVNYVNCVSKDYCDEFLCNATTNLANATIEPATSSTPVPSSAPRQNTNPAPSSALHQHELQSSALVPYIAAWLMIAWVIV